MRKQHNFKKIFLILLGVLLLSGCPAEFSQIPPVRSIGSSFQAQSLPGESAARNISSSEKRVALVIGNNAYIKASPLHKAVNDAKDISSTLRNIGFEVIYAENTTTQQMRALLEQFSKKLNGSALGLFYFAGHGTQYAHENFLVPVDFDKDYVKNSISASQVLNMMEQSDVPTKLLILDACRNWKKEWGDIGLADMKATPQYNEGTFIAFSTKPGTTAQDGAQSETNSPYAKALLKYISLGLPIETMFTKIRTEVRTTTKPPQIPWEHTSLEGGNLCLAPCVASSGSGMGSCKARVGQGLYDGECQNNIPHGHGVMRYSDGEYYQGSFSNGVRHGQGVQYLTDGTEVRGMWMNGRLR